MIKNIVILLLLSGLFFLLFDKFGLKIKKNNKPGKIIILNGPSCAGKTSIQKVFQELMFPEIWIKIGIDNLLGSVMPSIKTIPKKYCNENKNLSDLIQKSLVKVIAGMNESIVTYLRLGNNLIVDYILFNKFFLKNLRDNLKGYDVFFVKVQVSLETANKREQERNNICPLGPVSTYYSQVYDGLDYDLVVDSEKNSSHEIAIQIKNFIEKGYI